MDSVKTTKAIAKINRETKDGKIIWEIDRRASPSLRGDEVLLDNVYVGKITDRMFRLYRYQTKYFVDEDIFHWVDRYRLEIIDVRGNSLWELFDNQAVADLYNTVQFKTADVEGFYKDFLADEDDEHSVLPF